MWLIGLLSVAVGLGDLPKPVRLSSRTVALTYHDMVPVRDSRALWFDCTPKELEFQLDWLSRNGAHFASVAELEAHLTGGRRLPPKSVVITFADNYEGFYTYAAPILRRRRIPVTMFVHTDYVGNRQGRPKMTWAQLKSLEAEGWFTAASQTRTHPADLRSLSDSQLAEEMSGSKMALERQLGHRVDYVAYPNGKFDNRVARAAQAAGYHLGFTERLLTTEKAPNLFMIPRWVHTKYREAFRR